MVEERGKLEYTASGDVGNSEELKALKNQWSAFLENESEDREKYLRALEIEFSLESIAMGESEATVNEEAAKVFSEMKHEEREADSRVKKKAFRNIFKGNK